MKYVHQPTYFLQSFYDGFGIEEVLGYKCAYEFSSLSECTEEEREVIETYRTNLTQAVDTIVQNQNHSAFGIDCVAHSFIYGRWNDPMFEVPQGSGHLQMTVTSNWAEGKGRELFIDSVGWPNNLPCAKKVVTAKVLTSA